MRCELMHCDTDVGAVLVNDSTGVITDFLELRDADHMPFGTVVEGRTSQAHLMVWWAKRCIPSTRAGIREALSELGCQDTQALAAGSMGLSLSDCYWLRPEGSDLTWGDVNLFDNPFSVEMGDVIVGKSKGPVSERISPDCTTEGNERKRWLIVGGERRLLKSGFGPYGQEPYDEVAASVLYDAAGITHIGYTLAQDGDRVCSSCACFTSECSELVTAHQALVSMGQGIGTDYLGAFLTICDEHGLDVGGSIRGMVTMDFVTANTDRHMRNFGILRDPETLEWKGMAPVFDNGGSFGFDVPTESLSSDGITKARPFAETFESQMSLVGFSEDIDTGRLRSAVPEVRRIFGSWGTDPERVDRICRLVEDRLDRMDASLSG